MKGFREEVLVVGTKICHTVWRSIFILNITYASNEPFYGLDCYQYTYPENINYCLQQDNLLVLIAWLIPIVVVVASYVIGLLMYLLKM